MNQKFIEELYMSMRRNLGILILLNLWLSPVFAKRFTNQYTEFELPLGWNCSLEGSEWVCQSENKDRRKEAIIILAAKVRGQQDSLDQYQAYLKKRKTYTLPGGRTQVSEGKYARVKSINNHKWIDALHLASEVPGFYTRYVATVKANLGVAVTFSVSKDHYASYQNVFDKVIETLRVFAKNNKNLAEFVRKSADEDLFDNQTTFIPEDGNNLDISQRKVKKRRGKGGLGDSMLMLVLVGAAAGGFFFMKKKKGFGKKKKG